MSAFLNQFSFYEAAISPLPLNFRAFSSQRQGEQTFCHFNVRIKRQH